MSALAAVFCRDGGSPAPDGLARVSDALHGFGARGVAWGAGAAGLIRNVPESFTPEDASDPGMADVGDGRLLLFDGFLDHRRDLLGALGLAPREAGGWPDSALFACAWRRWGEDSGLHVEGDFTVVAWDSGRRTLTVLCSPLRPPPLFFSIDPQRALVASAPCAIFAWGDLPRRLNDAYLASGLILDYGDTRASFYEHVQSLRPGEVLTVTPDAHRIRRYYALAERVEPVRLPADPDYVEAAGEHLRRAVDSALRATETPSVSLSGGLDSPTVAVTALELLAGRPGRAPLVSFTAVPEPGWDGRVPGGWIGDEGPLVRKLGERYRALDARFVDAAGLDTDHWQMRMIERAELPVRNPGNLHWIHECRRLSHAAGRRTMLTGLSGNATLSFAGFPRLASLLCSGHWPTLLREALALPHGRFGPVRPLLKHAVPRLLPGWAVRRTRAADWRRHSAIHPEFARRMRVDERAREHRFGAYVPGARSCLEGQIRMVSNEIRQGHGRSVRLALRTLHDVADRDPLGDRRLVEWCLGLPDEQYLHRGQSRRLVKRLMRDRLPAEILSAPRGRQAADWHQRLGRSLPRLRSTFEDWRHDPEVAGRLDLDRLLRILDTWPATTPLSPADHPDHQVARLGIDRALATGRFIRWATGEGSRA